MDLKRRRLEMGGLLLLLLLQTSQLAAVDGTLTFLLTTWTPGGYISYGTFWCARLKGTFGEKLTRCSFCLRRVALTVTAVEASSDASRDSLESEVVISREA